MAEDYRIVTVHIAGTIYAQGTTVMPVGGFGALPIGKNGLLAIRTGKTTVTIGRPLRNPQTLVAGVEP